MNRTKDIHAALAHSDWVPVAWLCVTEPDICSSTELKRDVERLVEQGFRRLKCHLWVPWGAEVYDFKGDKNPHGHLVVLCAKDELERFNRRFPDFDLEKQWRLRDWDMPRWDFSKGDGAFHYALRKHIEQEDLFCCPNVYRRCKRGQCTHRP